MAPVMCVVTIHGIGFQQPPDDKTGVVGYADGLHQNLSHYLDASTLGDDPNRLPDGIHGPVYVHSNWPPGIGGSELGLARLGMWTGGDPPTVTTDQPLVNADQPIAHVALVYAHLEPKSAAIGPLAEITTMAAVSLGHYTSVGGLLR